MGKGAWRLALGGALWALGRPLTGKMVKVDEDVKVVQSAALPWCGFGLTGKVAKVRGLWKRALGAWRLALGAWRGALGAGQAADGEKGEGG